VHSIRESFLDQLVSALRGEATDLSSTPGATVFFAACFILHGDGRFFAWHCFWLHGAMAPFFSAGSDESAFVHSSFHFFGLKRVFFSV
jgi:hypothetical protein